MQQGGYCLANKLLQELFCVVLQRYSLFLSNFCTDDVVFTYQYSFDYAYLFLLSEHYCAVDLVLVDKQLLPAGGLAVQQSRFWTRYV